MMSRRMLSGLACTGFAILALGCSSKSNQGLLPGAVYAASAVQVYRNAELTNVMGSDQYGDEPDSHIQGQTWFLKVKDPKEKVLAFYAQQFPNAERTTNEDGSVTFRILPQGAEPGEDVHVTVADGEIRIGENCKPGKIKSQ
jgi:hypothetical protein